VSVSFHIEQQSDKSVAVYVQSAAPRVLAAIHNALKQWVNQGAALSAQKYFGSGATSARDKRNPGSVLNARTGALRASVLASADSGVDPASADATTTVITATWGADTPYARIQEYGGAAGRGHKTQIPPRPYLQPAFDEQRGTLATLLQSAVDQALGEL
jgi:phage gpG-like protein